MTRVLVPLADGVEEMEAVIIIDVLRRAGWDVTAAGVDNTTIKASRGVTLVADAVWSDLDIPAFDAILVPGGMGGVERLLALPELGAALTDFVREGKRLGAICAGPLTLQQAGLLEDRTATCHPGVRDQFQPGTVSDARVVWDGNIVTSQGPGTAMEFALSVIAHIDGKDAAAAVANGLIMPSSTV